MVIKDPFLMTYESTIELASSFSLIKYDAYWPQNVKSMEARESSTIVRHLFIRSELFYWTLMTDFLVAIFSKGPTAVTIPQMSTYLLVG